MSADWQDPAITTYTEGPWSVDILTTHPLHTKGNELGMPWVEAAVELFNVYRLAEPDKSEEVILAELNDGATWTRLYRTPVTDWHNDPQHNVWPKGK